MPIVSHIKEYPGVVRLYSDGRMLADIKKSTFKRFPLEEGDTLDEEAYLDRVAQAQFADAYEAALSILDYAPKSASALRQALIRKGYVALAADAAVERLTEARLINDKDYAARMVERGQAGSMGLYALKRKLRLKGISDEDADEALSAIEDDLQSAAALEVARKLAKRYEGQDARAARAKLSQALARRGFPWEAIRAAVEQVTGDSDDYPDDYGE